MKQQYFAYHSVILLTLLDGSATLTRRLATEFLIASQALDLTALTLGFQPPLNGGPGRTSFNPRPGS